MDTPSADRIATLPKWAREHIFRLNQELGQAHSLLLEQATTTTDYRAPGLHIGRQLETHTLMPLRDAHGMRLVLDNALELTFLLEYGGVTVSHTDRLGERVAVMPNAANSFHITTTNPEAHR